MLSRSLATITVVVAVLLVIVGGPTLGRAGIQPATPLLIDGDLRTRVAALETRVAVLEVHLGSPQGAPAQDASLPSTPTAPIVDATTGTPIAEAPPSDPISRPRQRRVRDPSPERPHRKLGRDRDPYGDVRRV